MRILAFGSREIRACPKVKKPSREEAIDARVRDLNAYTAKSHILQGSISMSPQAKCQPARRTASAARHRQGDHGDGRRKAESASRRDIAGLPSIASRGLGLAIPENRDIFPSLSVRQNLQLG